MTLPPPQNALLPATPLSSGFLGVPNASQSPPCRASPTPPRQIPPIPPTPGHARAAAQYILDSPRTSANPAAPTVAERAAAAARTLPLLTPFVPGTLRRQLASNVPRQLPSLAAAMAAPDGAPAPAVSQAMHPALQRQLGAVMIADVTGFTALTELLSQQGSVGLELLTKCMNRYFTQVRCLWGTGGSCGGCRGERVGVGMGGGGQRPRHPRCRELLMT